MFFMDPFDELNANDEIKQRYFIGVVVVSLRCSCGVVAVWFVASVNKWRLFDSRHLLVWHGC